MKLKNRVAIVTAAAGAGIGQATARMMAREGARVVVTDMHKERTRAVAKAIQDEYGVETMGIQCDVTRLDEVKDVVKSTLEKFGRIDILFNNAGTNRPVQVADMSDETWELVINTSLKGTFYFSRAVLPAMMEQKSRSHCQYYLCCRFQRVRRRPCSLCGGQSRRHGIYTMSCHGGSSIPHYGQHYCPELHLQ